MEIRYAYDRWSTSYDSDTNLTRDLDSHALRSTLKDMHAARLLEIGCGTGKNTAWLAGRAAHLVALDFSPGMLVKAVARLPADEVGFGRADLTRPWPLQSQSIEWVVCDLVLEHIEDLNFVFAEAGRILALWGRFFICELHPFKQYQGRQAVIRQGEKSIPIPAFQHHISDYLNAAALQGFSLLELKEWWHPEDQGQPPRLVSFVFKKEIPLP